MGVIKYQKKSEMLFEERPDADALFHKRNRLYCNKEKSV